MASRTLVVCGLLAALLALPAGAVDIDPLITDQLASAGQADVFVKMASDADSSIAQTIRDKAERRWKVYDIRTAHAARTQAPIRRHLETRGIDYQVFWINNSLLVRGASRELVEALAAFDGVAYLRGDRQVPLHVPTEVRPAPSRAQAVEWGVDRINAPAVWATGNRGAGLVVGNVDTGVRWTHSALVNQYRGGAGNHDYNWWDPDGTLLQPTDNDGHGTHTMGTMVGDDGGSNQIGVAPEATWIAAQGCDSFLCSESDLISSAQFMACPTDLDGNNPNCAMAPDIVNNSWGGGAGDPWYESYIQAYIDAAIIPVFSAGNSGSSCNTIGSPGDYKKTFSVANTTNSDVLANSSSRGPSSFTNRNQPDISAPGTSVRSSYNSSDTSYALLSGTSMSAPHVAGALALVSVANPGDMGVDLLKPLVFNACQTALGQPGGSLSCGGVEWNDYPSNHYGWGRLDVGAALGLNNPCD